MSYKTSYSAHHEEEPVFLIAYGSGASAPSDLHPERNEDDYLAHYDLQTFAVFDGMGGYEGSTEASRVAVKHTYEHFKAQEDTTFDERVAHAAMAHAFLRAHNAILRRGTGIATTAAALRLFTTPDGNQQVQFAHSGDSRIYRLRGSEPLKALTLDHTPFNDALPRREAWIAQRTLARATSRKDIDPSHMEAHTRRNLVSAGLGIGEHNNVKSTIVEADFTKSDRFLLTTDGIHDNLTTAQIERILKSTRDPKTVATALVDAAQAVSRINGFRSKLDDMTAVVVNISTKK